MELMSYAELAAEYERGLEDYKQLLETQKILDGQLARAEFILSEIKSYLNDPTSYKIRNQNGGNL